MKTIQTGDKVKYSRPQSALEASFEFIALHIEKGKVDLQLIGDYSIAPVETVSLDEVVCSN